MLRIDQFEEVFTVNHKYNSKSINDISHARTVLGGKNFFDRLLDVLHIKAVHLYPPKSNKDLRELHSVIIASKCPEHHKQSLLYYLLKDCNHAKGEDLADTFQRACYLPNKYWICMQGLWCLDKLQWKTAVEYLTQPSLLPVFSAEILSVLLKEHHALALSYYNAVQPPINSPELRVAFFRALCVSSVTEAFFWMRRQAPHLRQELLGTLVDVTLSAAPGDSRARKGLELVDLPFDEEEEAWFEEYLTKGQGRLINGGGDALLTRWMARGNWNDVLEKSKTVDASWEKKEGVNWENLVEGVSRGVGDRRGLEDWRV